MMHQNTGPSADKNGGSEKQTPGRTEYLQEAAGVNCSEPIPLQGRLLKIASMLDGCERPADIGTDHAYIPIYLVQTGKCRKVIATDARKGPLEKAMKNIAQYALSDRIELRHGDGLKPVTEDECDCFIIAGMGGVVISGIIEASFETAQKASALVLQPVYTEEVLREYLLQKGFLIETESLVRDEGRMYVVIRARYDGIVRNEDILYMHVGRALFEQRDPLLKEYLEWRIRIQTRIADGMKKSLRLDKGIAEREFDLLKRMEEAYASLK